MTGGRDHGDIVLGYCATVQFALETFAGRPDENDAARAYFAGLELTIDPVEQIYGTTDLEMFAIWMNVTCVEPRLATRSFGTALAFLMQSMALRNPRPAAETLLEQYLRDKLQPGDAAQRERWTRVNRRADSADDAALMRMTRRPVGAEA